MITTTLIPVFLLALVFLMVFLLADRFPWTTMIAGGVLIIVGITMSTGSLAPAIVWLILLAIGLVICYSKDRALDD